jgi:hypothetical protein
MPRLSFCERESSEPNELHPARKRAARMAGRERDGFMEREVRWIQAVDQVWLPRIESNKLARWAPCLLDPVFWGMVAGEFPIPVMT